MRLPFRALIASINGVNALGWCSLAEGCTATGVEPCCVDQLSQVLDSYRVEDPLLYGGSLSELNRRCAILLS